MNWCLEGPKQSVLAGSTFTEVVAAMAAMAEVEGQVLGKVAEAEQVLVRTGWRRLTYQ